MPEWCQIKQENWRYLKKKKVVIGNHYSLTEMLGPGSMNSCDFCCIVLNIALQFTCIADKFSFISLIHSKAPIKIFDKIQDQSLNSDYWYVGRIEF